MVFELNDNEVAAARAWQQEHMKVCPHILENTRKPFKGIPTLGEHWFYKFIPTGLGPCITVGCVFCGESKEVTDVSSW